MRNASELALSVNAAYIAGLQQAAPGTRIIVMNAKGDEKARDLARALNALASQVRAFLFQCICAFVVYKFTSQCRIYTSLMSHAARAGGVPPVPLLVTHPQRLAAS